MKNKKVIWVIIAMYIVCGVLFTVAPRLMSGNADMGSEITATWEQPFSEEELKGMLAFGTPEEKEYWDQHDFITFNIKVPSTWKSIQTEDTDSPSSLFLQSEYETITFILAEMLESNLPESEYEQGLLEEFSDRYFHKLERQFISDEVNAEFEIGGISNAFIGGSVPAIQREVKVVFVDFFCIYYQTIFRIDSYLVIVQITFFEDLNIKYPDLYSNILSSIEIK